MRSPIRPGAPLTPRDSQVLRLIANGHTSDSIAHRLGIQPSTARAHIRNVFARLGATDRASAVALAFTAGIIGPADITQTDAANESSAAAQGAVHRLLIMWRRTQPPPNPAQAAAWWTQRLDELSNAIRKDTAP